MTLGHAALWALPLLPAAAGVVLCLAGRRADRSAAPVALVVAAVLVVLATSGAGRGPAVSVPFVAGGGFGLMVDPLSAVVVVTVTVVTLLVLVFAAADVRSGRHRFHGLMLLFAAAVVLTATASTLPALLLGWEVMGATSYALIGHAWHEQHRVSSGTVAFLMTRTGDLGLYAAAAAALAGTGSMRLSDLPRLEGPWLDVAAGGVLLAALGKAAQLPFSAWLSRAMAGPSPVSALLHSAAMVAMGGYLLLRTAPLLAASGWAATTAAWVGALTALLLGAVAVAQRDLKQLLAASTAAQLGFVVLGAGVSAVAAGSAHLVAHAATKALLFLAAGAWLSALGTEQLSLLQGVARRWPVVGVGATVGALALAGVAPLSLWATKDEVLAVAWEVSPALYVVGLAAVALSAAYAGKILLVLWRRAPEDVGGRHLERRHLEARHDRQEQGSGHLGPAEQAPLVVLAVGAALLGVLALPPLGGLLQEHLDGGPVPTAGAGELIGSALLTLVVLAAVARWGLPEPRLLRDWLDLERATSLLVVRPVLRLSDTLARFDDKVLDAAVDRTAAAVLGAASVTAVADDRYLDGAVRAAARGGDTAAVLTARTDDRSVDGAVESLARQVRRLGGLARAPQTGQLHQYYLQVAAAIAVGVVVLLVVR